MDLFPDIEQAVPLPHEEVLRYMVCKIRDNRSEKWLAEICRKNNLSDIYQEYRQKGVLKALEGEPDVSFYPPRLTIELVPRSCWFDNVRSAVSSTDWKRLRQQTARTAGWKCQICGGKGSRWPVECHEIWHYDDDRQCQILTGLIALCPSCHEVKHMGFSELRGKKDEAVAHLALVNGWSLQGAFDYVDEAFDVWRERSPGNWISRGSRRRGLNARMRQQQRATTSLLRISFRWRLRFRLSRRRALRCPPSGSREAFPAICGQS
ncbi:hypothetical protein QE402_000085 [Klebsiella sp. SORGH_AS 1025]|nr:hypothetical protein [Klebsiella variicola]MDR6257812.1 hypothetical protein [Klebsiella sp. SORGH_AS_0826]MDR6343100.1 hypothetical protein [Klebsiella sp. SORGH_AS_1025]MDR6358704.1 hypothetical protein [Klebsiella sp. SORGH_AS_1173]MDR6252372.1 hypothetical protein [Klebsiella variicola]